MNKSKSSLTNIIKTVLLEEIAALKEEQPSREERIEMLKAAAAKAAAFKAMGKKPSKQEVVTDDKADLEQIIKSVKDASEDPKVKSLLSGPWKKIRPVLPEFAVWLKDHLVKSDIEQADKDKLAAISDEETSDLLKAIVSIKKMPPGFSFQDMASRYTMTRKEEIEKLIKRVGRIETPASDKNIQEPKQKIEGYWKLNLGVDAEEEEILSYAKWMFDSFVKPNPENFPETMRQSPQDFKTATSFLTTAAKSEDNFIKAVDLDLKDISQLWAKEDKKVNKFGAEVFNQMAMMDYEDIAEKLGLKSSQLVKDILMRAMESIAKRGNIMKMSQEDFAELNGMILDAKVAAASALAKLIVQASKIEHDATFKLLNRLSEMLGLAVTELSAFEIENFASYVTALKAGLMTPVEIKKTLLNPSQDDQMRTMQNMTAFYLEPNKSQLKGGRPPKDASKLLVNLIQDFMGKLEDDNKPETTVV